MAMDVMNNVSSKKLKEHVYYSTKFDYFIKSKLL